MSKRVTRKSVIERPEAVRRTIVNGIMRLLCMKKTHLSAGKGTVKKTEKEVPCNNAASDIERGPIL